MLVLRPPPTWKPMTVGLRCGKQMSMRSGQCQRFATKRALLQNVHVVGKLIDDLVDEFLSDPVHPVALPKSWCMIDGEISVRLLPTLQMGALLKPSAGPHMYGPVPMKVAHLWPVMTTYR